jgi:CheY-like chemotaxis protein
VDRLKLQKAVSAMVYPPLAVVEKHRDVQDIKGKPLVLVVEDNLDNMITVKAMLSDEYDVIEAHDGYEGIRLAKEHVPHLILMDIALPGISGIEAFTQLRAIDALAHIPCIALTASAMEQDRELILSHGFDAFIAKPIIAKDFYRAINEILYGK